MLRGGFGLKDAPRLWQKVLDQELLKMGCRPMKVDPQLYVMFHNGDMVLIISCHVDDIKGAGTPEAQAKLLSCLERLFVP